MGPGEILFQLDRPPIMFAGQGQIMDVEECIAIVVMRDRVLLINVKALLE